ncbi:PREDICTED: dehydrogenase/reductase SDR family member on chromosome X [Ceratosolen solmsi marchali]|uniref:Dehydrogenase/reductase SDR family member on chromosome X n=1 Tax=Ceratosolen solmsi marchali TaxID=326594 RepID=A0AAJ6VMZ0_9HYME|nr:PREDICTED: dehydrogenase/reductase SDR family member on chromosome X [Ceratosolen solmsi marchali]XP_011495427.1 PREDICTED: dehydrogenase/reductase SDR family member on chromosome X [Ceratosolen solmsi marchali]XP_011495428.1 PREDICTED: dehydrogenase/reductase SDR family member on chromosome X [Ceratosolen solmsi marchali]
MLLFIVGSTLAALLGLALVKKMSLACLVKRIYYELQYNMIGVKGIVLDHLQASSNRTELPQLTGKIAIVTGGSRGMGTEVVRMLLKCDMTVIIACRSTSAGENSVKHIRESNIETGKTIVMELDNSSLDSVRRFVKEFYNKYDKLDILINNAGVMFTPYKETIDGFEEQYGVNYLSHFLLTISLIPLLKNAGTSEYYSRIINVSSCAHLIGNINFDDINLKENFVTGEAYAQSKLALLLFTKFLSRFFETNKLYISVNAVHPGIVNTELFETSYHKYLKFIRNLIFKKPEEGATSIVFAAVSPQIEQKSGIYISNCLESSVMSLVHNKELQDRLVQFSLKQI